MGATLKTKRASAMPPDERRSMIVAATLPLLVENGDMVTTRQIADAAGIAEGTIFRVFRDKDEVITAAVEMALAAEPFEAAIAGISADLRFEEKLEAAVAITQRRVVDIWRLLSGLPARFHEHRGPMEQSDALAALLATSPDQLRVEPVAAARLLRSLTLSLTHPMLAEVPMPAADIVTLFLHGATKEP